MENQARERAILVGIQLQNMTDDYFYSSLKELENLADTAGADVVAQLTQKRTRPDNVTYVGKGKVEELRAAIDELEADLLIFDGELSPIQLRNLENVLDIKIIDRTTLIIDIFAMRAKSREGILQVELARLSYKLPRLTGRGQELSRQGGGIGSRGAGEQKLELDRRHIRRRIDEISRHLEEVKRTRELHRAQRKKAGIPVVSLVGYTNAGKSTLFNAMYAYMNPAEEEQVEAENKLFKTLDITTRKMELDNGWEWLLSDTVGFIQNLPHKLVKAFHSTLEEAIQSDLLLHVIDSSSSEREEQITTVEDVLKELGAIDRPVIKVYNKADLLETKPYLREGDVLVSSVTGEGMKELLHQIEQKLFSNVKVHRLLLPYDQSMIMSKLHRVGEVTQKDEEEEGWRLAVRLSDENYGRLFSELEPYFEQE
ncbi:GTPase HflX [Ammoniphilus sp. YIM 78166]|uniref:GTPase HflX n=1 Tax=Ammoniphilus sp. YIM 78166 TaxID=1644106 RepID=UPI00106F23D0|nr:GTPase HflX [Ammoniphilus sp. YIM 78166]